MARRRVLAFLTALLMGMLLSPRTDAATKYKPCSLLTAADLETALQAKVSSSSDRDQAIPEGAYKGEIVSTCDWLLGSDSGAVGLSVIRGPKNQQEQAAGLADLRAKEEGARQRGWTIEPGNIPGAECFSAKPPGNNPTDRPFSSCAMVSKGLAFILTVVAPSTVQQVKALADKVAARLP